MTQLPLFLLFFKGLFLLKMELDNRSVEKNSTLQEVNHTELQVKETEFAWYSYSRFFLQPNQQAILKGTRKELEKRARDMGFSVSVYMLQIQI